MADDYGLATEDERAAQRGGRASQDSKGPSCGCKGKGGGSSDVSLSLPAKLAIGGVATYAAAKFFRIV